MAGYIVFSPDDPDIGFTTGDDVAVNVFLDILTDTLYYSDGAAIYEWEGGSTDKTYTWKSGKLRTQYPTNMGAALVEAETYSDVVFKLYAEIGGTMTLKHTETVSDGEPFRLPGGYSSSIFEIQLTGTDVVSGVAIGETVFDLAEA
jgi:hypothetical protein